MKSSSDPLAWWTETFGECEHGNVKAYCPGCSVAEGEEDQLRRLQRENLGLRNENEQLRSLLRIHGIQEP